MTTTDRAKGDRTTGRRVDRVAQRRAAQAGAQRKSAQRRELKAAIAERLQREVPLRWGSVISPLDGGWYFRRLADAYDEPESTIAEVARSLGYWPWSAEQVGLAMGWREGRVTAARAREWPRGAHRVLADWLEAQERAQAAQADERRQADVW